MFLTNHDGKEIFRHVPKKENRQHRFHNLFEKMHINGFQITPFPRYRVTNLKKKCVFCKTWKSLSMLVITVSIFDELKLINLSQWHHGLYLIWQKYNTHMLFVKFNMLLYRQLRMLLFDSNKKLTILLKIIKWMKNKMKLLFHLIIMFFVYRVLASNT